ncbi:hypothetical protein BBJ28_00023845 [Nothophytophthora sp. Chile5]|nr:hypothetical protein BBJ28_00023845 [Nothophytophthora sp. Chile5]
MDIVTTSNFHATLLPALRVLARPRERRVRAGAAHSPRQLAAAQVRGLLLLYGGCSFDENEGGCVRSEPHVCRSAQTEIFSIVSDREGATLFMDPNGVEMFKRAIHLGPMVAEFPGVVSFLSKLLADGDISILNMSTYDTDVIFVQEQGLEAAVSCLQSKLSRVYPESLVLVRLQKDALRASAYGLTQLILLSTGAETTDSEQAAETGEMSFWCCCETAEEVSLIMDECCLASFEEESLIVSPDRWRAIKLNGRTFGFDETGVVAAMSGCSTDSQVLNVSCFGSNVAFVLDDMLDDSIATLCASLDISRVDR